MCYINTYWQYEIRNPRCAVAATNKYVQTEREQAFRDTIENPKYDREIINGLKPFFEEKAPDAIRGFYSKDELAALQ